MTSPQLVTNMLVTIAVASGLAGAIPAARAADEPQHDHTTPTEIPKGEYPSMNMTGMLGPYGMTREASGTSWQPDSTPMSGRHLMWQGWTGMLHGYMNAVYSDAGGARGETDVFAESMFMANGREPDENRYNIETGRLDSWAARVSYNAGSQWSMQGSFGRIRSPEQLEPDIDVDRTTFSVAYNRPLAHGNWQATLAWGRNAPTGHKATSGYLLESAAGWGGRHTVFARAETAEKDELFLEPVTE